MLRSAACLHKNQSRSYLNHLVITSTLHVFENVSLNTIVYKDTVLKFQVTQSDATMNTKV